MTGAEKVTETDELTTAVVAIARHSARQDWGQPPRLYALARRAALASVDQLLPEEIRAAPPDALIPIEQDPLPEGEPADVLAGIRWSAHVVGCVLVTDAVIMLPDPGQREGRLTAGVLREPADQYACCLQLRDEEDLIVRNDLADELVAALLGTFLT